MSSLYVGHESLSMITDIIVRYSVSGFDSFQFTFPQELMDCFNSKSRWLNEKDVFEKLRKMNIDAVNHRYGKNKKMYDELGYSEGYDIWKSVELNDSLVQIQSWHYQLLKSLHHYIYQCSEGKIPDTELYKGIEKLINNLENFIATNQPEYEEAEWR